MKKALALLLVLVMLTSMVACKHKDLPEGRYVKATVEGWSIIDKYSAEVEVVISIDGERYSYFRNGDQGLVLYGEVEVYLSINGEILDER